ncbi:uncharacterized protein LOC124367425 isoform X2 [Homalodisca vitripennis]|uniref:uncharacterized protein LOC124367425 isoform X2 n=1 Tax=Homalodisca vitripennis TaxID=197043 RepID=UPI001EEB091A|nr:uncharacterized protein LOC124367425 isoform X2 [Homalodisca vitripennis]
MFSSWCNSRQNYIAQCSGSESLNLLSVLTMDNVESNKIPTRVSRDHRVCALCLLSNMEHTGVYDRGLWLSEVGDRDFQQATSETTRSIQQTANFSSRIYIRPEPALVRWKMAVRWFLRDFGSLCSVAVGTPCLCFVYGFVFLTLTFYLSHLIFKGIFSILLFLLLVSLITVMSLALPVYCWRSGIMDRLESRTRRRQRVEDPIPIEMPVEKPPLYETLVFTTPESAMASLPPPSYEVAIQASEIPQILQPDYNRDANVAASLCPVHQQNSTRHPDITLLI